MAYSEEYPFSYVAGSNLLCLIVLAIAFVGMYPVLNGLLSAAYLLVFILLWLALKKSKCSACEYYGKQCGTGWGKVASFFYKRREKEEKIAPNLVLFTWVAWFAVFPFIVLLCLTAAQFSYYQLGILLLFCIAVGAHKWLYVKCCPSCCKGKTAPARRPAERTRAGRTRRRKRRGRR